MAELPQNWIECELQRLVDIINGYAFKSSLYVEKGYRIVRITNVQKGFFVDTNPKFYAPTEDLQKYELKGDDILLSLTGNVGRVCIMPQKFLPAYLNQRVGCLRIKIEKCLNYKYLFYQLSTDEFEKICVQNSRGNAQLNLGTEFVKTVNIKLPPLNEQKRIVEKLDKMMRIVDNVNARLDKIPTALKRARQSILNQAITGELTKDWREKNVYSSAKELISKLEIEKNNIYAKECEIAKSNETKKPQKPKYFRIANNVLDINIPNQWSFINLSQTIYDFKYGTSTKSDYSYKGIPVIRIPNISNMKLSFDDLKYLNLSDIDSSNKIKKDDILIVRSNGSRDLVGKNALVKELDKEYAFASYLIRMRPLINNPEYLILLLNTDAIKEQFFSKAKSSAGINNINTEELATTIIPLPPLEEQAEIVRRVKLAFEKLDKIELRYQKAKEYSDKLTQSILNKAFRGELVPQDPNDSPIKIPE